ncbi:uncharacterized protein M6B38_381805 [Iris pallida]|uniref:Uncharacterized protein n=1 Tax=Iris pallida TaxID=29817 RepID=A0AAX6G7N7_IRIPA|nr:uncharacterized protein M6B38_381805 [Iris pallida]
MALKGMSLSMTHRAMYCWVSITFFLSINTVKLACFVNIMDSTFFSGLISTNLSIVDLFGLVTSTSALISIASCDVETSFLSSVSSFCFCLLPLSTIKCLYTFLYCFFRSFIASFHISDTTGYMTFESVDASGHNL